VAWLIRRAGPPRHPPKSAGVDTLDMEPAEAGKDLGLGAH
jgi:hypothetical protein